MWQCQLFTACPTVIPAAKPARVQILKLYKEKHPSQSDGCFSWRRLRDYRLCLRQMLSGLAWCARLFRLKTVYYTVFLTAKPSRVQILELYKEKHPSQSDGCFSWRRLRDLNPRDGYPPYALSRGASSANLSTSPKCTHSRYLA